MSKERARLDMAHKADRLIITALRERIVELENQWISVEDRLPEMDSMVLVYETSFARTDKHDEKFETSKKRPRGVRFGMYVSGIKCFRPEGCNGTDYDITHWMPLPEPPND